MKLMPVKEKLSEIDKKIIKLLTENGRMKDAQIASVIGVSDDTIRRRRNRLEKLGLIRIEAILNLSKFGYQNIYHLGIILAPGIDMRQVAERLAKLESIYYVALSLGPTHSIIAHSRSRNPMDLNKLVEELRKWNEIERIDVNIIYDVIKANFHRISLEEI